MWLTSTAHCTMTMTFQTTIAVGDEIISTDSSPHTFTHPTALPTARTAARPTAQPPARLLSHSPFSLGTNLACKQPSWPAPSALPVGHPPLTRRKSANKTGGKESQHLPHTRRSSIGKKEEKLTEKGATKTPRVARMVSLSAAAAAPPPHPPSPHRTSALCARLFFSLLSP